MKNKLFFATLFFAVLAFGFVGCENPDSESGISIEKPDDDSTSDKPNDSDGSEQDGNTKPTTPEAPTLVATGDATEVGRSSVKLWGRINTDTLWAFNNVKWGIECSTTKEAIHSHSGNKTLCSTDLVGENSDEYAVAFTGLEEGKMLYYNAYLLINDIKYIYGEMDSVHLDVILTINTNNSSYGTVTGSGTYDHLAEATITATPKENYYFTGWSDCDSKELTRTITLTSDSTITANFAKKPYLTVKSNNTSYGTVTGSGYYMPGDEVTITATPKLGSEFVKWSDGNTDNTRTVIVNEDITYNAIFELIVSGTENGFGYIDLGLPSGLKWAVCNVGATKPEEYGNYYAWGESFTKSSYTSLNYKYFFDPPTTLPRDAAAVNMGGEWRMPTYDELNELKTECIWKYTRDYGAGKEGIIVVGKNGNHIFLPVAGYRDSSDSYVHDYHYAGSCGFYWSSSLNAGESLKAYCLEISVSGTVFLCNQYLYYGMSVRGVLD